MERTRKKIPRMKELVVGIAGSATTVSSVRHRLENLPDVVRASGTLDPYGRRHPGWIPGMFAPDAGVPELPVYLDDLDELRDPLDCEVRGLPASLAGGIVIVAVAVPDAAKEFFRAVSETLGVRCAVVESLDRGNVKIVTESAPATHRRRKPTELLRPVPRTKRKENGPCT